MAYSTASPAMLVSKAPLVGLGQEWFHTSADAAIVVDTTGFVSNGGNLGMKVGDLFKHRDSGTGVVTSHRVVTVSTTAPGAVDLGDGTVIGLALNTD